MLRRLLVASAGLAVAVALPAGAQTIRWNDRGGASDTTEAAPRVNLWFEGPRVLSYGDPVRVWMNVSEDAHVIVARVDGNGHLTLLYPSNRRRSTQVKGGEDILLRGVRGQTSFYAFDRMGGGFVFALASYDPFDLSRLGLRDFDRYVTGMYVGRPTRTYVGDPQRVVARFSSVVLFSNDTPYDYAVDFYSVDPPNWVASAGFSSFCNGAYGQYRRSAQERWDDEFQYGYGAGSFPEAGCAGGFANCFRNGWGYGNGFSSLGWGLMYGSPNFYAPFCGSNFRGRTIVTNNPGLPPFGPGGLDSSRVAGWFPDTSTRPPVGGSVPDEDQLKGRDERGNGRFVATVNDLDDRRRNIRAGVDQPIDKSYSIPGRALRNSPTSIGDRRERGPGPDRVTPSGGSDGTIAWVRPPRGVSDGPRGNLGDGTLPRSPRNMRGSDDPRGGNGRPSFVNESRPPVRAQPPRMDPPRFDTPRMDLPSRTNSSFNPPSQGDRRGIDIPGPARSGGGGSSSPSASPPPPPPRPAPVQVSPPADTKASTERKPG